jgi:hypothetical protein
MEKKDINFETDWDVEVSAPSSGTTFLRLKNGESAVIRVLSKPFEFKEHWHDGRSVMCGRDEGIPCAICGTKDEEGKDRWPRKKFAVVTYVHAAKLGGKDKNEPMEEVRVFEMSGSTFQALQGVVQGLKEDERDWKQTDLSVARGGEDRKPIYTIMPRSKALSVPEGLELPDLNALYTARLNKHVKAPDLPAPNGEDPFEGN